MSEAPSCGNCRFWLKTESEEVCRRFPPSVTFIPASGSGATITMPQTISYFPGMKAAGWCGEHLPKVELGAVHTLFPELRDGPGMK